MKNRIVFSKYCQGASHKPDKRCEDFANHFNSDEFDIITISDGHGDKKCFRSYRGAQIATYIAIETLKTFCKDADFSELLGTEDIIKVPIAKEADVKSPELEYVMRHVFQHICSQWHQKIEEDFNANPCSDEELAFLHKEEVKGRSLYDYYFDNSGSYIPDTFPSIYGCTLFGVAVTKEGYWIGFHIGDGQCMTFYENGGWDMPIPWDERCILNITTSLSHFGDESFRYCIGRQAPAAIFIASDGMDDSFAPMEELAFEYATRFLASLALYGDVSTAANLAQRLDKISENYSRDDMSIAYIVAREELTELLKNYIEKEEPRLRKDYETLSEEAEKKSKEYNTQLQTKNDLMKEQERVKNELNELERKGSELQCEYDAIEEELKKKERGRNRFLEQCKMIFTGNTDWIEEKKEKLKSLFTEINELVNQYDKCGEKIKECEINLSSIQTHIPILKKHAREAERELNTVKNKLERIDKIKRGLKI